MANRTTIKGYFNTGDTPTESQFAEFIDSTYFPADDGTPELASNKTGTIAGNESSTSLFPHVKGVVDWIKQGFTGLLSSLSLTKGTPVDADSIVINDSADSNKTKLTTWANVKATLKTYYDTLYQVVLVSGTNIKTINGTSVLGSGNLVVGGSFDPTTAQIGDITPTNSPLVDNDTVVTAMGKLQGQISNLEFTESLIYCDKYELPRLYVDAVILNSATASTQVTNLKYRTSFGGSLLTPSFPMSITAGTQLWWKIDYVSQANTNGNIEFKGIYQ